MIENKNINIQIDCFENFQDLNSKEQELVHLAISKLENAYAPYSRFQVSCAVLLEDGSMHFGTNQENASYPVGSCAEQVALKYVGSNFPNVKITSIAIIATPEGKESKGIVSPCGMCRQTLLEYETKQNQNFKIILFEKKGNGYVVKSAKDLLPLHFGSDLLD